MTSTSAPTVFIIDDDADVRVSIQGLLRSVGLPSESFASPSDFLRRSRPDGPRLLRSRSDAATSMRRALRAGDGSASGESRLNTLAVRRSCSTRRRQIEQLAR